MSAGAWGISFANVFQASVGVHCGIQNIIIANQVFQSIDLDSLSQFLVANSKLKIVATEKNINVGGGYLKNPVSNPYGFK